MFLNTLRFTDAILENKTDIIVKSDKFDVDGICNRKITLVEHTRYYAKVHACPRW